MGKGIQLPLTGSSFHLTASFDSIFNFRFNIVPKCCTHCCSPAGVALPSLLPVEDTPPPLLPPSCLLHAAGFRKRKREYWCVFRKVWTSLTFWNQRYRYRIKADGKLSKVYTYSLLFTYFYTVKGIRTTDVRSVQSFLYTAIAVIPVLRVCLSEQETSENALI